MTLACFKAYDVRGRVPEELDEGLARRIGRAFVDVTGAREVVVGRDIRLSSPSLATALAAGLNESGADVLDIGVCGTEEVYFSTAHSGAGGGIMVTASHNPPDYNGMKFVRAESRPISGDTGLKDIRRIAESGEFSKPTRLGERFAIDIMPGYIEHLLSYVDRATLKPLKIVVHAGNGGAGLIVDKLEPFLPFEFIKVEHEPDGSFPNGVPNPMLIENHRAPVEALRKHGADLAISWDGDYDRCFFFDEHGSFIEGYYIVGLLASVFLQRHPGSTIVHDPRLTWNTLDVVAQGGGKAVQSKSGHAFIKQTMREVDGIYGGEMSAHHYFRNFSYCDSGMIPWLLVTQIISDTGKSLSELVGERIRLFPASGEINRRVEDAAATIDAVLGNYRSSASNVDFTDGVSVEFDEWRFNLRASNTEPLIRLNVESRGNEALMREKTAELLELIGGEPG